MAETPKRTHEEYEAMMREERARLHEEYEATMREERAQAMRTREENARLLAENALLRERTQDAAAIDEENALLRERIQDATAKVVRVKTSCTWSDSVEECFMMVHVPFVIAKHHLLPWGLSEELRAHCLATYLQAAKPFVAARIISNPTAKDGPLIAIPDALHSMLHSGAAAFFKHGEPWPDWYPTTPTATVQVLTRAAGTFVSVRLVVNPHSTFTAQQECIITGVPRPVADAMVQNYAKDVGPSSRSRTSATSGGSQQKKTHQTSSVSAPPGSQQRATSGGVNDSYTIDDTASSDDDVSVMWPINPTTRFLGTPVCPFSFGSWLEHLTCFLQQYHPEEDGPETINPQ